MNKVNVVAVSYSNTIPFLYGIRSDQELMSKINLSLEYPSRCSELLISGQADIGLIPVVEIPNVPKSQIIGSYCIGSEKKIKSVMLYSDCPLHEINSIALDYQSRTSVMLTKVLANNFWKIDVEYLDTTEGYVNSIIGNSAGVVIGDRSYDLNGTFQYEYDLAEQWFKYTGLPFVFACWVANKPLNDSFKKQFCLALGYGVLHKELAIDGLEEKYKNYINNEISYVFDANKQLAMDKFLFLSKKIS